MSWQWEPTIIYYYTEVISIRGSKIPKKILGDAQAVFIALDKTVLCKCSVYVHACMTLYLIVLFALKSTSVFAHVVIFCNVFMHCFICVL